MKVVSLNLLIPSDPSMSGIVFIFFLNKEFGLIETITENSVRASG